MNEHLCDGVHGVADYESARKMKDFYTTLKSIREGDEPASGARKGLRLRRSSRKKAEEVCAIVICMIIIIF